MHSTNEFIQLQDKKTKRTIQVAYLKMMFERLIHYGLKDGQLRHMWDVWLADVSVGKFALLTDDVTDTLTFTVKHGKMSYTYIYPNEFYWALQTTGL